MSESTVKEAVPAAWIPEATAFPVTLPVTLHGYVLVEELHSLGPSTFFDARNEILGHPVILRRLAIDPARPDDARETFFREQRHTASLMHPNIPRPIDVFDAEGSLWSVHERWDGEASLAYVRRRGPLDVAAAARLGAQVADALSYMHARGFVHGKIHPYTIGISGRGDAMLYNLVKSADLAAGIWPLRAPVAGISPFTSPEEVAGAKPTPRSDLFSLAATLCYWMCGVEPDPDESVEDWLTRSKESPVPGTGSSGMRTCDHAPQSLIDAVCFALELDPEQRHGSVDSLGSLLVEAHQRLASEMPSGFSTGAVLAPDTTQTVEIVGHRGSGAFGVVLEARDVTDGRRLAVKALKPEHRDDSEARQRFLREARAMHAVGHPHVVRIHAVGEERGTPYAVMDFIDGPDLHKSIKIEGALPPERVARLGAQIASGLAAIHAEGIVHRDLKPHNVLLAGGDHALIADFGVAHEIDRTRITGTGRLVGTPAYMAPEMFGGAVVTAAVDLYALGAMLFEMLTGSPPFAELDLVARIRAVREDPAPPLPAEVPAALRDLVARLMAKAPDARPTADVAARTLASVR